MEDIYNELARKLNSMPQGYPTTASGVELKILRKIYSHEDAAIALKLSAAPETLEEAAQHLGLPLDQSRDLLDRMAARGQIASFKLLGRQRYFLPPFIVGIYEYQLDHIDRELAELFEEYIPHLGKVLGGSEPALARVIPLNKSLDAQAQILPYEDMRGIIEKARSFQLMECICRKKNALLDKPCSHPLETCLMFSREPEAFDYFAYSGRTITKEEALSVIELAAKDGLVHCSYNVQKGHMFVCNCCSCCCEFLRGLKEFEEPYLIASSDFVAAIDPDLCAACGICAEQRCPVEAIALDDGNYVVDIERCIGCGVCTITCSTGAIALVRRPEEQRRLPPKHLMEWAVERGASRWSRKQV
jgi:electron transport complex protein RnfB